jgi:alanine racemase
MFDVTDLPDTAVKPGNFVELFGPNIPLDDAARAAGTIGYELLTSLGRRYARTYVRN